METQRPYMIAGVGQRGFATFPRCEWIPGALAEEPTHREFAHRLLRRHRIMAIVSPRRVSDGAGAGCWDCLMTDLDDVDQDLAAEVLVGRGIRLYRQPKIRGAWTREALEGQELTGDRLVAVLTRMLAEGSE